MGAEGEEGCRPPGRWASSALGRVLAIVPVPLPCTVDAAPLSSRAWLLFCPQDPNHASRNLTSEPVTLLVIRLWQQTGHL